MKEEIRKILLDTGAEAVGFALAGEVDSHMMKKYGDWIEEGCHGEMDYLKRHLELKRHTDNVLPGTKTVISLAYNYFSDKSITNGKEMVSAYSLVDDYHIKLREILSPVVEDLKEKFGSNWRICIDSAPVAERYWAQKSGIGVRGINGCIMVKNCGAYCFLVEILTDMKIEPDAPVDEKCEGCGECVRSCPGAALRGDGTMDARKCINYLTIEKKGEFNREETEIIGKKGGSLFGCDRCLKVCPRSNHSEETSIKHFEVREEVLNLSPEGVLGMTPAEFKKKFKRSPLLYAGYRKLQRNAEALRGTKEEKDRYDEGMIEN